MKVYQKVKTKFSGVSSGQGGPPKFDGISSIAPMFAPHAKFFRDVTFLY
jgi:hypothetical protein